MYPQAFLIDLDGTLVDSEPLKGLALADTCALYGGVVSAERYVDVMGRDWPTVTSHFFKCAGIDPLYEAFNAHFQKRYLQLLDERVELTHGAKEFIAAARAEAIKVALVSSAAPWMVEKVLDKLQLAQMFDLVITQADVTRHKPDPEAYLLALARLDVDAAAVMVFEDSEAGLKAAAGAGCKSIAIAHPFNLNQDKSQAQRVVGSFAELVSGGVAGGAPFADLNCCKG